MNAESLPRKGHELLLIYQKKSCINARRKNLEEEHIKYNYYQHAFTSDNHSLKVNIIINYGVDLKLAACVWPFLVALDEGWG